MRARLFVRLAVALIFAPAAVLCAPAQDQTSVAQSPAPTGQDAPGNPNKRLLTPQEEGRQGVVKGVAEQPLRDLNVIRSKIPPVLRRAMLDPYERPEPNDCQGLFA